MRIKLMSTVVRAVAAFLAHWGCAIDTGARPGVFP